MDLAKIRKKAKKGEAGSKETLRKEKEALKPEALLEEIFPSEKSVSRKKKERVSEAPPDKTEENIVPEIEVPAKIEAPPLPTEDAVQKEKERLMEKLLVFKVGRNKYAIPIGELSQIIDDRELTPVPYVPPFLKGIFSLRGHIVGVLDVAERLCLPLLENSSAKKIIVLEKGGDLFGLRVENIEHVVEVDIASLEAPPDSFDALEQEFVLGVFHYKKKTVAFLNLELFLDFNVAGAH